MSRWVEVDDEGLFIDFADKEVSFFVTNDAFGSVYLLLSFDQIKEIAKKIDVRPTEETHMKAAIAELEVALETMETNEPINRLKGNIKLADLEATNAADFRQALAILRAASNGPIWPEPKA